MGHARLCSKVLEFFGIFFLILKIALHRNDILFHKFSYYSFIIPFCQIHYRSADMEVGESLPIHLTNLEGK